MSGIVYGDIGTSSLYTMKTVFSPECGLALNQAVIPTIGLGMASWREHLFAVIPRMARDAADYYGIPANRVIELETQAEI